MRERSAQTGERCLCGMPATVAYVFGCGKPDVPYCGVASAERDAAAFEAAVQRERRQPVDPAPRLGE